MRRIVEGFRAEHTPDMKYYAFDWDDNIVHMPTKIVLKTEDGDEVGMSTDDFAEYRHNIGKKPFDYNFDYSDNYNKLGEIGTGEVEELLQRPIQNIMMGIYPG